jgi:NAD(P)-dependent dehydrogenase (short-subunit alcohol dehydrogenase family)
VIAPSWSPYGGSGPSRIAKVIEFLATDLSDYVTGAVIPIDGGLVRG